MVWLLLTSGLAQTTVVPPPSPAARRSVPPDGAGVYLLASADCSLMPDCPFPSHRPLPPKDPSTLPHPALNYCSYYCLHRGSLNNVLKVGLGSPTTHLGLGIIFPLSKKKSAEILNI